MTWISARNKSASPNPGIGNAKPPIGSVHKQGTKTMIQHDKPLIHRGLHYRDATGYVHHQACVLDVIPSGNTQVGDLVLIQYFSWLTSEPTTQRLIPLIELATNDWIWYDSLEAMNEVYDNVIHDRNKAIKAKLDSK